MSEEDSIQQQLKAAQAQIQLLSQQLAAQRDVTCQTESQLQKLQSQIEQFQAETARLQWIINTSPATTYTTKANPPYTCTYVSQSLEKTLGYPPIAFLATPNFWEQLLHPEDAPRVFAEISELFERGRLLHEYRVRHRDGHYVWIRDELILLRNSQEVPQEIIGYFSDISEQKQLEIQRKQSELARQELGERLSLSLKAGGFGSWYWDLVNDAIWDERTYEIFGLQGLGRPITYQEWRNLVHPDDIDLVEAHVQQAIQNERHNNIEFRILRPNKELHWVHGFIYAQRDEKKNVVQIVGIIKDITERKTSETELRLAYVALERAVRLKDEFLANMSHELRTPLNAILGMTENLQEEIFGTLNEGQLNALNIIEKTGTHLLNLINEILDISKIASGQVNLEYSHVNVESLCSSCVTFIKPQALKKRIRLEIELNPHIPDIFVDELRIRQVLLNLLGNAVKFTDSGGTVTVAISLLAQQQTPDVAPITYLRIAIEDTGIGIAPENISKLFQPFVQIDGALNRKHMGTGLGLALVKQLVELHGGEVEVTSEPGVGSCFIVTLPYTSSPFTPEPEYLPGAPEVEQIVSLTSELVSTRQSLILLAEDNPDNVAAIGLYLEAKGYNLLYAIDGQEAIDLSLAHQPDLILMDIQMPRMDGLEAIRQIRQKPSLLETPIIALTALAMEGDHERCLMAGANEYLSKPIKLKRLDAMIKALLTAHNSK